MRFYIDHEYRCHINRTDGASREAETEFFNGKCQTFIEGYRFVPVGESWTREDGVVFAGEMIAPWKPYAELDAAQREYERQQLADMHEALADAAAAEAAYKEGVQEA